jgi:hypothetical protein
LANLPSINRAEARRALRKHLKSLRSRLDNLKQRQLDQQPLPNHVDAMFDYSETLVGAEISWIENFVSKLEVDDEED